MTDTGERGGIGQRIVDDYAGHKLYDERGEKVGKVEYTVLDTEGKPEYIAVKTGWFGSNTTLIPESLLRPGERDKEFEVQASEDRIKDAPTFDNEGDVDRGFEDRVREHFGVGGAAAGAAGSTSGESHDRGETRDENERGRDEGRSRDDDRAFDESRDRDDRDRGARDRDDRDRDVRSEGRDDHDRDSRGDRDDRGRDDRDRDDRDEGRRSSSSESRSDTGGAAAGGAAAGGAAAAGSVARDDDRGERRDDDRRDDDRGAEGRDDRGSSGSSSGGEREKVRVTVKREHARAERVRGKDGTEEVRIRKEMVEEEEMVEVEDRL